MDRETNILKRRSNFSKWLIAFGGFSSLLFFEGKANNLHALTSSFSRALTPSKLAVEDFSSPVRHISLRGRPRRRPSYRVFHKKRKRRVLSFQSQMKLLSRFANQIEKTELYRTVVLPDKAQAFLQEEIPSSELTMGVDWGTVKGFSEEEIFPYRYFATELTKDEHSEFETFLSEVKHTQVPPLKAPPPIYVNLEKKLDSQRDLKSLSVPDPKTSDNPNPALASDFAPRPRSVSSLLVSDEPLPQPNREPLGTLYGKFSFSKEVLEKINTEFTKGWHVELHLEPVHRMDTQTSDIRLVPGFYYNSGYAYPTEFEIPEKVLVDTHRLWARVYAVGELQPVANLPYTDLLRFDYGEKIRFYVGHKEYEQFKRVFPNIPSENVVLNITVFEGAAKDFRAPKVIPGASVKILNFPAAADLMTSATGNVRIPNLPNRSEIVVQVTHPDYFSTETIIPLFQSNALAPVYLLPKQGIYQKGFQSSSRGLVVDRVYDPLTRRPTSNSEVHMSYRKDAAVSWSDGLFSFLNVIPSVRSITRKETLSNLLLEVKENFGYYLESGRFGKKTIAGKTLEISESFTVAPAAAKLRVVGQKQEFYSNSDGSFEISNLEISPGVLALEVESPDQEVFWFTIPIEAKENLRNVNLYLLEKDMVFQASKEVGRKVIRGMGKIFGGANSSLFERHEGCNSVELISSQGLVVQSEEVGPFLWGHAGLKNFCLTSEMPRFLYQNLLPGRYFLNWVDKNKKVFRTHVLFVGKNKNTISVN